MPRGILNKLIYVNGVWKTSEEVRDSLLNRNLPPPVTDTVIEGGLESFQQEMGNVIFSLPNKEENIPLDKEKIKQDIEANRESNLKFNKYPILEGSFIYEVTTPSILLDNKSDGDYSNQNFGVIGITSGIGIRNPFTAIESDRTSNFDTNLGNIGSIRLELLLNERIAQATKNETIDRVNTNLLNVAQGNELIQSNYDITTQSNIIGKGVELIGKITGVQLPISTIPNGAIGWQEYNTARGNFGKLKNGINNLLSKLGVTTGTNLTTEKRTTELLKRTGPGQKNALFALLKLNQYTPDYSSPRLFGVLGDRAPSSIYYVGNEESTNRGEGITKVFKEEEITEGNSILDKTEYLKEQFSETGVFIDLTKKFFKDKLTDKVISRGNAIKDNSENYARVWLKSTDESSREQIEKGYSYQNAIRKSGLFTKNISKPGFSVDSGKASLSVLQSNGMVKHYPYLDESFTTYKKYMLSLENLAWSDDLADLPIQEIGPGDLVSGRKGRIMWFAPYDLSFDETTTANWNPTEFLGRGEPVYTYNNTKRSGTFKFKILVDHPRIVNEYRGRQNNDIEKFLAGITTPQEFLDLIQRNTSIDQNTKRELEKKANSIVRQSKFSLNSKTEKFSVYFADGIDDGIIEYNPNNLNDDFTSIINSTGASDCNLCKIFYDESITVNIETTGHVCLSGKDNGDIRKSKKRSESVNEKLVEKFTSGKVNIKDKKVIDGGIISSAASTTADPDSELAIKDRRVDVVITYYPKGSDPDKDPQSELNNLLINDLDIVSDLFINETTYFDIIAEDYPNYFDNISSKITYFQPGFHSNTPEGLNTRLTFLQQCMRQGRSIYDKRGSVNADNLAFGRPPVCILRIGDFIHTKIIINSLTINYAAGSNIQWDLNPEGVGVQPMLADVSMSIEIIGGQSLQGPINRLQNAMSYNFYANTEMYDPRADSIRVNGEGGEIVDGVKLGELRGKEFSGLTEELKTELPIDQEATRLKAEANEIAAAEAKAQAEADAKKQREFIIVNTGTEEREQTYTIKVQENGIEVEKSQISEQVPRNTIIVVTKSGETQESAVEVRPGLLVDNTGDNRLKVTLRGDVEETGESFETSKGDINVSSTKFVLFDQPENLFKKLLDDFDKEVMDDFRVNGWKQVYGGMKFNGGNKYKKLEREQKKLEKKRDKFIEENVINITVKGDFTKDTSNNITKNLTFKLTKKTPEVYYWKLQS